jgi:hypothetical protein
VNVAVVGIRMFVLKDTRRDYVNDDPLGGVGNVSVRLLYRVENVKTVKMYSRLRGDSQHGEVE